MWSESFPTSTLFYKGYGHGESPPHLASYVILQYLFHFMLIIKEDSTYYNNLSKSFLAF